MSPRTREETREFLTHIRNSDMAAGITPQWFADNNLDGQGVIDITDLLAKIGALTGRPEVPPLTAFRMGWMACKADMLERQTTEAQT